MHIRFSQLDRSSIVLCLGSILLEWKFFQLYGQLDAVFYSFWFYFLWREETKMINLLFSFSLVWNEYNLMWFLFALFFWLIRSNVFFPFIRIAEVKLFINMINLFHFAEDTFKMDKIMQFLDNNKFPLVTILTELNSARVYSSPNKLQVVIPFWHSYNLKRPSSLLSVTCQDVICF